MSGFVGILNLDGARVERALLEQMTRFLAARGPDEQRVWVDESIGFGHALLRTTFEADTEHQPCALDDQFWITADARIDGRTELCATLLAHGRSITRATNDAELILHAYAVWGTNCVEHLIGDFAFALWDVGRRKLLCARDQFGVTPFFYARINNSLLFSNTLNCLLLHPALSYRLNERAIGDVLLFGVNQDRTTTTFADIMRLPPAHSLIVANEQVRIARYWTLPEQVEIRYQSSADTVAQFRELFTQAIADRLRTVHVAVPMSGGLDSTSVAVTAKRQLAAQGANDLRAFTIAADHSGPDAERHYAGLVASYAGIPIEFVWSGASEELDSAEVMPEPGFIAPSSGLAQIAQRVAGFSRVMLSGLGGDPILYPSSTFLLHLVRDLHWFRFAHVIAQSVWLRRELPPLYIGGRLRYRLRRFPPEPFPNWLCDSFSKGLDLESRWHQVHKQIELEDPRRGMAEAAYWSNMLSFGDPGYSGSPIKIRFPFFDVRLLKFMRTVPPTPWLVHKTLLREAMRGQLPEVVRTRPKTPLAASSGYLHTRTSAPQWMLRLADSKTLEPYIHRQALINVVNAPANRHAFQKAQYALTLAYWLENQPVVPRQATTAGLAGTDNIT